MTQTEHADGLAHSNSTGPAWWRPETAEFFENSFEFDVMEHELLDGDDSAKPTQQRLRGAVQAARFRRLAADTNTLSAHPRSPPRLWFHGHCVENTLALLDELKRRDIECRPITGSNRQDIEDMWAVTPQAVAEATRRNGGPLHEADRPIRYRPPTTAEEAYSHGCQHHWVEARLDGAWWTVDLAQYRFDEDDSVPFIGLTTPEPYKTYPDSREFAAEYFESIRRDTSIEHVAPSLHIPDPCPDSWLHAGV